MNPILVLSLPSGQKVGVVGIAAAAFTFVLLDTDGVTLVNPSAVNEAPRSSEGIPDEATIIADIAASLP